MSVATPQSPSFCITLGSGRAGVVDSGLPVIAGSVQECLFGSLEPAGSSGSFGLFRHCDWLAGAATVPLDPGLEVATRRLYRDIFPAVRGLHLARIWNYVPAINGKGPDGLENYQAFCHGRSLAFEEELGSDFKAHLPAASAVGSQGAMLTVVFAASTRPVRHVENPLQVPAYDYPQEYGPRPPSFARATLVEGPGPPAVFISGTSAVRGHATIAPDSTGGQLDCTLENLRELSVACDLGPDLAAGRRTVRHFKIFLRRVEDLPVVHAELQRRLLRPGDDVCFLQADICRTALNIEIEATMLDPTTA